jgi:hypothetical protein
MDELQIDKAALASSVEDLRTQAVSLNEAIVKAHDELKGLQKVVRQKTRHSS